MMIPAELYSCDRVRVPSPAASLSIHAPERIDLALQRLESLGPPVTLGCHSGCRHELDAPTVEAYLGDLCLPLTYPQIITNLISLAEYKCTRWLLCLYYELIRSIPEVFSAYPGITALDCAGTNHKDGDLVILEHF